MFPSNNCFLYVVFDQGQKGSSPHIPHHASPAVAASAAAAREAAAAGNGEIFPATSLFVRKVPTLIVYRCYVGVSEEGVWCALLTNVCGAH